jgi:uncharacterized protein
MKQNQKKTFVFLFALAILNGYSFNFLNSVFNNSEFQSNQLSSFSPIYQFFILIVFGPLFETFVFQYLPNVCLHKMKISDPLALVILPSLLFGLAHYYSLMYIAMTFFAGLILNSVYIYYEQKSANHFLITALFHSLYNLYGYAFIT